MQLFFAIMHPVLIYGGGAVIIICLTGFAIAVWNKWQQHKMFKELEKKWENYHQDTGDDPIRQSYRHDNQLKLHNGDRE